MNLRTLLTITALSATIAGAALLSGCNSSSATAASAPTTTATLSDYFKSTDWVALHASDANLVIVDTRTAASYNAGHIPGAINIPRNKFYFPRKVIDTTTGTHKISATQLPVWDPANAQVILMAVFILAVIFSLMSDMLYF